MESGGDYAIDGIVTSIIIVYIIMVFLTLREVEVMRTEYRVGEGKRAECKPAYMIGETGNYNLAEALPNSLTNLIIYFKISIYITLFMSGYIVVTTFAANKTDFAEYWKFLPTFQMVGWGCIFAALLALMFRYLGILKQNKVSGENTNRVTGDVFTPLTCTSISIGILTWILKKMDKPSAAQGTRAKLMILFLVTIFTYAIIMRQSELKVAYDSYKTSTQSLKESLDIIQNLPLTKFDKERYLAYLAESIAEAEQKRFTSETLNSSYLDAKAQTWKYILNEDGGELSKAFPEVAGRCSANLDIPNAAPDVTKFAMSRKFFACTIPAKDPAKSYFQYQRLDDPDASGGRVDAIIDGKTVNLIDAFALAGLKEN